MSEVMGQPHDTIYYVIVISRNGGPQVARWLLARVLLCGVHSQHSTGAVDAPRTPGSRRHITTLSGLLKCIMTVVIMMQECSHGE